MPVIRRKAPPKPELKGEFLAPAEFPTVSLFLSEKETRMYLKCSKHETRELVRLQILKPIPYLRGRVKPWRFLRSAIDQYVVDLSKAA